MDCKTDSEGPGSEDSPSVLRKGKVERPCPKWTCQGDGDCDGRLVWASERAKGYYEFQRI